MAADTDGVTVYEGSPFVAWEPTERWSPGTASSFWHLSSPFKVVAVGRNYVDHAAEMDVPLPDEPVIFLKPPTSVVGPGSLVVYPRDSRAPPPRGRAFVGRGGDRCPACQGGGHRPGDLRLHLCQRRDRPRTGRDATASGPGQGIRHLCPLGPAIETELDLLQGLLVTGRVDGEVRQEGSTADMVFGVELVEFITRVMTLLPGDVILTGTLSGCRPGRAGQVMEVEVEGIGVLGNLVVRAAP